MAFARMIQYTQKHLLGIQTLSKEDIYCIFQSAKFFSHSGIHASQRFSYLQGKTVVLGFFESSTRTRCSFELAAKRLGAETLLFQPQGSSLEKGETLLDTLETIDAMGVDIWVVRHSINGSIELMSNNSPNVFINAGEGNNEHPTQALLDGFTLLEKFDTLEGKRICIVGDILHSRVARSDIYLFQKLGAEVALCGPDIFMPDIHEFADIRRFSTIEESVEWADAINMLRIQKERIVDKTIPTAEEYNRLFGLRMKHIQSKPTIVIMHPGPANYGIEIDHEVAHSPQSVIQRQVRNGVAVRMAVLTLLSNLNM
ncbi:MAG TPA: aspartate carbamoyltransferase catalytic subunit [Candidatus Kapabacteria bacterium]|jgi:aspartate carbamoyltransferase catalytic subunit|nr:aspartate carbamoyltransferase catalytic subunit [Candidatus Kapabacteria bacterium]